MACGNEAIASYPQPRAVLTPGLAEFLRELEMTKAFLTWLPPHTCPGQQLNSAGDSSTESFFASRQFVIFCPPLAGLFSTG